MPLRLVERVHRRFARKAIDKIGQLQQVCEPQCRPSITHHNFRIRPHEIRPSRRNRPNRGIIGLQQDALAMPIVSAADTRQSLREQRVKRVRDPH